MDKLFVEQQGDTAAPVDDGNVMGEATAPTPEPESDDAGQLNPGEGEGAEGSSGDDKGFLKRINKITWQREEQKRLYAAEKEKADRLQATLDRLLAKGSEESKAPVTDDAKQKPAGKPKQGDFETDEEFFGALADWKIEQRETQRKLKREQEAAVRQQEEAQRTFIEKRDAVNTAGVTKYNDYEQVVFSLPPDVMDIKLAESIFDTEHPEDVAYYLGLHADEAEKISKMSPRKQAIALGRLESKIKVAAPAIHAGKSSNAPAPVARISPTASNSKKIEDYSVDEYIALKNAGKI
jgi:hypothetical protein